jgi:hypothetical protein
LRARSGSDSSAGDSRTRIDRHQDTLSATVVVWQASRDPRRLNINLTVHLKFSAIYNI